VRTVLDILNTSAEWLGKKGVENPRFETELLLAHALDLKRMELYLNFDRPLSDDELSAVRELVKRRGAREPFAYIVGSRGFHAVDLQVGEGVLVPRPDTEALVEAALEWIGTPEAPIFLADIGTGSGAIALAMATALPLARVYAVDLHEQPLATTKANVQALGLSDRVAVLRGHLLDPIPAARPIDWVLSNPPYIPSADIDRLMPEVAEWEPRAALDGGPDGLDIYRELIPAAAQRARCGVLVEVGFDQAPAVKQLMEQAGLVDVRTWKDLGGHHRVVGGKRP